MLRTSCSKLSSPAERCITRSMTKTGQPCTPTHTASMPEDSKTSNSRAPYTSDKPTRRKASVSHRRRVAKHVAQEISDTYQVCNAANTIFLFQLTQIYRPETVFWSTCGLKENGADDQERWPTCAPSVESQR